MRNFVNLARYFILIDDKFFIYFKSVINLNNQLTQYI